MFAVTNPSLNNVMSVPNECLDLQIFLFVSLVLPFGDLQVPAGLCFMNNMAWKESQMPEIFGCSDGFSPATPE